MKSFKWLYFLPAILFALYFVLDFARWGDPGNFLHLPFWLILLFMVALGVMMYKGKIIGAYLGIAFGISCLAYDIIEHKINGTGRLVPMEVVFIPLIILHLLRGGDKGNTKKIKFQFGGLNRTQIKGVDFHTLFLSELFTFVK